MLGEELVERMLFWLVAAVWTRLGMGTGDRHGAGQAATCGPLGEGRASGRSYGVPLEHQLTEDTRETRQG